MRAGALVLSIALVAFAVSACRSGDGKPAQGSKPVDAVPAATAGEPPADQSSKASAATGSEGEKPVTLVGGYTVSEVQKNGVVTMISAENATDIIFTSDGSYVRTSKKKGRVDHSDSGRFRIEGKDKLVLSIQVSGQKIQVPAVEKTHTFALSPDGDELRLTAGVAVAVFLRTLRPSGK